MIKEVSSKIKLSLEDQLELDNSHSGPIHFTQQLSHSSKDGIPAAYLSDKAQALKDSKVKWQFGGKIFILSWLLV